MQAIGSFFSGQRNVPAGTAEINQLFEEINLLAQSQQLTNDQQKRAEFLLHQIEIICHFILSPDYKDSILTLSWISDAFHQHQENFASLTKLINLADTLQPPVPTATDSAPSPSHFSSGLLSSSIAGIRPPDPAAPGLDDLKQTCQKLERQNHELTARLSASQRDIFRLQGLLNPRFEFTVGIVPDEKLFEEVQKRPSFDSWFDGMLGKLKELEDLRRLESAKLKLANEKHRQEIELLKGQLRNVTSTDEIDLQTLSKVQALIEIFRKSLNLWREKFKLTTSLEEEIQNSQIQPPVKSLLEGIDNLSKKLNHELGQIMSQIESAIERYESSIKALSVEKMELEVQNHEISAYNKKLEAHITDLQSLIGKESSEIRAIEEKLRKAQEDASQIDVLKKNLAASLKKVQELEAEISKLKEELFQKDCKLDELSEKAHDASTKIKSAERQLKQLDNMTAKASSLEEELEGSLKLKQSQYKSNQLRDAHQKSQISELERSVGGLQQSLDIEIARRTREELLSAALLKQVADLEEKNRELTDRLKQAEITEKTNDRLLAFIRTLDEETQAKFLRSTVEN